MKLVSYLNRNVVLTTEHFVVDIRAAKSTQTFGQPNLKQKTKFETKILISDCQILQVL
jgi:hypothetical protein